MTDANKLGKRVSKYREQLGLTQEQLAVNAGLDLAYLQDVESGAIYPPIGMLIRLSRALGQRLGTFMDDQFVPDPIIVRASSRSEETSSRGADGHYHYFPLGKGKTDRHMEPLFIRIGVDEIQKLSSHEGEEFIIVVSGKVATYACCQSLFTLKYELPSSTASSPERCAIAHIVAEESSPPDRAVPMVTSLLILSLQASRNSSLNISTCSSYDDETVTRLSSVL